MSKEPAITIGTVSAAVAAIIGLAVAFGAPITEDQQIAILGVVAAVGPIVAAVLIRHVVTPVSKIDRDREPTHRADV